MQVPGGGLPSASPVRRKTDRIAFPWAVPAAKERGDRGRWNYPSHATAAFEMVLSPGAGRTSAAGGLPFLSPAAPVFTFLPAPIPPTPFPAGRGRLYVYFAGGFAPGTPALNRLRHLQSLPNRYPRGLNPGCTGSTCQSGIRREEARGFSAKTKGDGSL